MKLKYMEKLQVKCTITQDEINKFHDMFQEKHLEPNSFFDEIEKINHSIEVPYEYREILKGHVCMCGKLIVSSFLPKELKEEYHKYTAQKATNTVVKSNVDALTDSINKKIMANIIKKSYYKTKFY